MPKDKPQPVRFRSGDNKKQMAPKAVESPSATIQEKKMPEKKKRPVKSSVPSDIDEKGTIVVY